MDLGLSNDGRWWRGGGYGRGCKGEISGWGGVVEGKDGRMG